MSIVSLAIANVHQEIYHDVLVEAFLTKEEKNYFRPVNLDAKIMDEVIVKRVMPDLNVEYSRRISIPLTQCQYEMENVQDYIITIPPELLNNCKIITVLGINYLDTFAMGGITGYEANPGGAIMTAAQKMANSTQSIPANYNTNVQLISGNSFVVRRAGYLNSTCVIELIIENDPELNNIPITMADTIKELVLLATKWYIHLKLKTRVNRAFLESGSEMTFFNEVVEEYKEANERYKEILRYMSAKGLMADEESKTNFMRLTISSLI